MILPSQHPDYRKPLDPLDAETSGVRAAEEVERYLSFCDDQTPTPLHRLTALAAELGVHAIHIKDEGLRLNLGSLKGWAAPMRSFGSCWKRPAANSDERSTSPSCTCRWFVPLRLG